MGNHDVSWMANVAPAHETVVWQEAQAVEIVAAAWFGSVVPWYAARWHEAQSVLFPAYTPSPWQPLQVTVRCAPVSGKPDAA